MYALIAQQPQQHMWFGDGHMGGMHWGWWIFWIAVVALLIWLVARTTRTDGTSSSPPRHQSPEEILRERFARGEISEDEYRERLRTLKDPGEA